ncbi:kelch-like protein 10 [Planococcus citri]|uniref:kelch-like protein 10 n=1 Tax=Planococcus citri TaxID=170843 RepID=UPI0031F8CEEA
MSPEMLKNLNDLRLSNKFCDAKIIVDGKTFLAHRAILAGTSKYFCALFTTPLETSTELDFKVTRLPWINKELMEEVLNYTYTRKFDLNMDNAFDMYVVCDYLCIDSATEACVNFLKKQIDEENCIEILSFARSYLCPVLSVAAERFTLRNFQDVANKNNDILECELKDVINIVSSNHLNVYTEEPVWQFVLKWVNHRPDQRKSYVSYILGKIRLGIMNETYFIQNVAQSTFVCDNDQCKSIIDSVNNFFRDCSRLQFINEEVQTPKFAQPRIPHDIVFAVGGWSIGSPTAVVESYDSRADRWMRPEYMLDPEGARAYHGCAILDGKMYVIGGFDGLEYFNSCRCYDFESKQWHNIAPMNTRRCYVSVAVLNGVIYAMGGYDGHNRQSTAEKYDPTTNQWTLLPNMNVARSDADATTLNDRIYITGGFNGIECLNTAEIYDSEVNEWSLLPPMLFRRSGVSCIAYNNMIYVLGGFDGTIRLRSVERFDPTTETWSAVPDMLSPRSNFAVEVIDDVIIVIGGFNGIGTTHYVECYDKKLNEWRHASDMSLNRSALSACLIHDLTDVTGLIYEQREALMEEKRLALHALLPHTPDSDETISDNLEDLEL